MDAWVSAITWLVPGVVLSAAVAVLLSARVGRALGIARASAWLLVASVGWIVAATLTPISSLDRRLSTACDLSRLGPPTPSDLTSLNDTSLNVILFIPLGIALALAVRRPASLLLVLAAVVAPVLIEALQLWLPALRRGCQGADVIDNLLGLAIGLCIGVVITLAGCAWTLRRSP